jgi:nucleoid-associated protein YgaU
MGRVEKLVVLAVLFSITAILVISMNTETAAPDSGSDVLADAGGRRERWGPTDEILGGTDEASSHEDEDGSAVPPTTEPAAPAANPETQPSAHELDMDRSRASGLLASEIETESAQPALTLQEGWALKTVEGLTKTLDPETMLYTCREGEDFASVALRFYGDAKKADLLQRNNEGLRQLTTGRQIFVPARDTAPASSGQDYLVQEGDNLWGIAKKVYGKGSRWEEILDANAGLLRSPDALRAGMVLHIP